LPHWYVTGAVHFVTYRLAGTIPLAVHEKLRNEMLQRLRQKPSDEKKRTDHRARMHKQFFAKYEDYLDGNRSIDWLARPKVAAVIRANLYHHNNTKYHLLAYCVMPNHVHVLLQPIENGQAPQPAPTEDIGETVDSRGPLAAIMHSLKSYTANEANKILGRSGQFWQHESYDHWVRDDDELARIVDYIAYNPVKAALADRPHQWFFCSAHDRFLLDGEECGYLPFPQS
jgi:putative transposase